MTHLDTTRSTLEAAPSIQGRRSAQDDRVGMWFSPAVIAPNNFVYKSLSNWAFNVAVGCSHACRFCYVPSAATIKQGPKLTEYGVNDPDAEWGDYVLLRPWDEEKFLASLRSAENTPRSKLKPDGNRAVMYCSTTDPYQVIHHSDPERRRMLGQHARGLVRRSLELIRDHSRLNVRILTRSPLARADFDLFKSFGPRLLFGMSLPTLRNDLSRVYEPKAPAPSQRLAALHAAREAGLHVYVAVAPTYPECDEADLRATLKAMAELEPVTVFHEPINIRAKNIGRINSQADILNVKLRMDVFQTRERWQDCAVNALQTVERLANELLFRFTKFWEKVIVRIEEEWLLDYQGKVGGFGQGRHSSRIRDVALNARDAVQKRYCWRDRRAVGSGVWEQQCASQPSPGPKELNREDQVSPRRSFSRRSRS